MAIHMFVSNYCPYCDKAKALLEQKGLSYETFNIQQDQSAFEKMHQLTNGARTVPQIIIHGKAIGGCDDLYALEEQGKLDALIQEDA